MLDENSLKKRNEASVILKTGRFDNRFNCHHQQCKHGNTKLKDVSNFQFCTALLILLMMTVESMLSKRPVVRIAVTLLLLLQLFFNYLKITDQYSYCWYVIVLLINFFFVVILLICLQCKF